MRLSRPSTFTLIPQKIVVQAISKDPVPSYPRGHEWLLERDRKEPYFHPLTLELNSPLEWLSVAVDTFLRSTKKATLHSDAN